VPRFSLAVEKRGALALVALSGELDLPATATLELVLDRLVEEPGIDAVALDLRGLDFMDSSGLRLVVLTAQRLAQAGRRLVLVRGGTAVMRVFEITRMTERLEFVDAPEHVLS
jgi:anti-sigma B factor antagonist